MMISEGAFDEEADDEPPESQISGAVVHDVGDDGEDDEDDDKQDHVEFAYAPNIDVDHGHVAFVDDVFPFPHTHGHEDDGTHEVHVNDDGDEGDDDDGYHPPHHIYDHAECDSPVHANIYDDHDVRYGDRPHHGMCDHDGIHNAVVFVDDDDDDGCPHFHINDGTIDDAYAQEGDGHRDYPHRQILEHNCNDIVVVDDDTKNSNEEEFVEYDPSGTYGRYTEVLGKGAMKTVYRAYHLVDCKEVAWNKSKTPTGGPEEQTLSVQREIYLLQMLKHKSILKLYSAWVNETTGETNFITELCSSTLLNYRLKHKHISRKAVISWGRQILTGLAHLHTQNPPIIHRDLKCENIFVKCSSNDTLKIGDFGSAAILDETHHMHTLVGTPEFMAPEIFQEDYNELADIYSFGMCMLELLTREYPYSECKSLAQIYKKVISGEKPQALLKVKDVLALKLINRCLLPASQRPSAMELLDDPFLQCKERSSDFIDAPKNFEARQTILTLEQKDMVMNQSKHMVAKPNAYKDSKRNGKQDVCSEQVRLENGDGVCAFRRTYHVSGKVEDENILSLRIRIQELCRSCDIDFQFDLRSDTPRSVAEEMVRALGYPQSDLMMIADLISRELSALVTNLEEILAKVPTQGQEEHSWPHNGEQQHDTKNENGIAKAPLEVAKLSMEKETCRAMYSEMGSEFATTSTTSHVYTREITAAPIVTEKSAHTVYDNQGSVELEALGKDKLTMTSLPSATNGNIADISVGKVDISMNKTSSEGTINALLGKYLYWNHFTFRNHTKFQHIPAGISILLTPSSEQSFRRPFKSLCVI